MTGDTIPGDVAKAARAFASGSRERISPGRYPGQQTPESHLKAVAQLVASVTDDQELVAAAWLHDMVEDSGVTVGEIERRFGKRVARLVAEITPVADPGRGVRSVRLALEKKRLAAASVDARTIRQADLIDTVRDARRSASEPARVVEAEARELATALLGGAEPLEQQLARELERAAAPAPAESSSRRSPAGPLTLPPTALRAFDRAFSADDIAEPLRSFDGDCDGRLVLQAMREAGVAIAGVRQGGAVAGYLDMADLGTGPCRQAQRDIVPAQVVAAEAPLGDVIEILTRYDWCFVTAFGSVAGVVSRSDVQKPAVRMWLFGIITVVEIEATERLRRKWPEGEWAAMVSPARLAKARELLEERQRRHERCELVDCLQLSDKLSILVSDTAELAAVGIPTVGAARRVSKQIERLRNSLAHSQGFVEQDWPQVVRLARRVANLATGGEGVRGRT